MTVSHQLGRVLCGVLLALLGFSASAQFGPPRGGPDTPTPTPSPSPSPLPQPNPGPNPNPNPNPGPGPQPEPEPVGLSAPPWLVPGYQATYAQSYSRQPNPTNDPNQPAAKGYASQLLFEYNVIAVLQNQVIFQVNVLEGANGLALTPQGLFDPNTDGKYHLIETSYKLVDAKQVVRGHTLWMPVPMLGDLAQQPIQQPQTAERNGLQTQATIWPYAGQQVNALSIQVTSSNFTEQMVFNRDTGHRIFLRIAEGKARPGANENDPFNRELMILEYMVGDSPINSPLLNRTFPEWTRSIKSMRYEGTQTLGTQAAMRMPIAATLNVEQNDGSVMVGKLLLQAQGAPDQTSDAYMGPGSLLGYWLDPGVLAQLREGPVHRNPITRSNIYYRVQDTELGRLGVFVTYNDSQSVVAVNGYNLQDGSLVYLKFELTQTGVVRELHLKKIEQR